MFLQQNNSSRLFPQSHDYSLSSSLPSSPYLVLDSCSFNIIRSGFHLIQWASNSIRKWLVAPVTFVPLLQQLILQVFHWLPRDINDCRVPAKYCKCWGWLGLTQVLFMNINRLLVVCNVWSYLETQLHSSCPPLLALKIYHPLFPVDS